jgi:hypothetical protein
MPILNKDGTVFRLKGPDNPPTPKPDIKPKWDMSKVILHNFDVKPEIKDPEPSPSIPEVNIPEPVVIEPDEPGVLTQIHCLPGRRTVYHDRLYDEVKVKLSYDEPFIFEGMLMERGDLRLVVVTEKEVPEWSIIFPKNGQSRWWRVNKLEKEIDFYKVVCSPSDEQPSF